MKEEVTGQLAESLFGTVPILAQAYGFENSQKGEEDFFKAMESGKLKATEEKFLAFARGLSEMANKNGALEAVTKKTRAEMNRFFKALTFGKDEIFQGGMGEGLSYMFSNFADILNEFAPTLRSLGAVFKGFATGMTTAIGLILTPLEMLQDALSWLAGKEVDGTTIWNVVGTGGSLMMLAMGFTRIAQAVGLTNVALSTTLGILLRMAAPFLALEDLWGYSQGKESITGRVLEASKNTSKWDWIPMVAWQKSYQSFIATPTVNVQVSTKDSEFGKAIKAEVVNHNQQQMAVTNAENGG